MIFGEGLVATVGEQHKRQRKIVNPAFSVPQLRMLVPIFYEVAHRVRPPFSLPAFHMTGQLTRRSEQLTDAISNEISHGGVNKVDDDSQFEGILDMSQWMSRAALESVGQGILGYSFDPLNSPSTNRYTKAVRELMFVPIFLPALSTHYHINL